MCLIIARCQKCKHKVLVLELLTFFQMLVLMSKDKLLTHNLKQVIKKECYPLKGYEMKLMTKNTSCSKSFIQLIIGIQIFFIEILKMSSSLS